MIYVKTDKGRAALLQRDILSLRERQLMVLCNGVRAQAELCDLFGDGITEDIDRLERRGLLAARLSHTRPPALKAVLAQSPGMADAVQGAVVAQPPTSFVASRLGTEQPPAPQPTALPRMTLQELAALADVPAVDAAVVAPVRQVLAESAGRAAPGAIEQVAAAVNSIDAEQGMQRSPVAAQAYMTQVLLALDHPPATQLVETHGNVRHEVDILLYLAQALGQTHAVAGEDVALRVAMRVARLLPPGDLPMLLDCVLDYVPHGFSVLLYEFVLAGRETASA